VKPRAAGRTVPGLGRLVANLVARCHCSVRVRSCHLRCDWLHEYFCCWRGVTRIGESVRNNRCGEGYRLTDRTRQTCLRITIAARFIRNGHAHRAMRVKFPARFFIYLDPHNAATTPRGRCIIVQWLGGCQVHRRKCYNATQSLIHSYHGAESMFVQHMAKTEMTRFWQFMFDYCNEEYSCVLGWGMAGVIAFLAIVLAFGALITRANKRRQ